MKKPRRHLPVLQVDHVLDIRLGGETRPRRESKYPSEEIKRDAALEVEPLPYEAADGPACSISEYRRFVRRRAARALQGSFEPVPGVPASRSQCPTDRHEVGCVHLRCRAHLWTAPRAGRPGIENVPRSRSNRGRTERVFGDLADKDPPDTIVPRWLEPGRIAPSCMWDVIKDGEPMGNVATAEALARHRTLIARETTRAVIKLRELGYDIRDVLQQREPSGPQEPTRVSRRR